MWTFLPFIVVWSSSSFRKSFLFLKLLFVKINMWFNLNDYLSNVRTPIKEKQTPAVFIYKRVFKPMPVVFLWEFAIFNIFLIVDRNLLKNKFPHTTTTATTKTQHDGSWIVLWRVRWTIMHVRIQFEYRRCAEEFQERSVWAERIGAVSGRVFIGCAAWQADHPYLWHG